LECGADEVVAADATVNASGECNCTAALAGLRTTTALGAVSGSGWDEALATFTLPTPSLALDP
jgi:hypothetical protein